jgi:hypothetical protein
MPNHAIIVPSKPKIIREEGFIGTYEIDGLYPGYGHTLGNSLRRIILSSIPGAAVTQTKIKGVEHEFSSNTTETAQWQILNGTDTWRLLFSAADWISDRQYYAKVRALDRARDISGAITGNQITAFTQGVNKVNFIVDNTAPTSRVVNPTTSGFFQSLATIGGTSNSDLSGASTYYFPCGTSWRDQAISGMARLGVAPMS